MPKAGSDDILSLPNRKNAACDEDIASEVRVLGDGEERVDKPKLICN
jgi:hypothetical protein